MKKIVIFSLSLLVFLQFHVMRDYLGHDITMLGGLWGAKIDTKEMRIKFTNNVTEMLMRRKAYSSRKAYGVDQVKCGQKPAKNAVDSLCS